MRILDPLLILVLSGRATAESPRRSLRASMLQQPLLYPVVEGHWLDQIAFTEDQSAIRAAVEQYEDPVDALLAIRPHLASHLATPRLLAVNGKEATWMTEGDKLRLRREGRKFRDLTAVKDQLSVSEINSSPANTPKLTHGSLIKPLFSHISTSRMLSTVNHMSSYHTRYYTSPGGIAVSRWVHDQLASIIAENPQTYISLRWHRHAGYPQSSVIARFEPRVTNSTPPLTVIGAHLDSVNSESPLLRAPGADDDASGTAVLLEAFRVLATSGYAPERGPVEFQWYAAEEEGMLGSLDLAIYAREMGVRVGAALTIDMVAYVSRKAPEHIAIFREGANTDLNKWLFGLMREYSSIGADWADVPGQPGSDFASWTYQGYPACGATEGNPLGGGKFPGYMNPNWHKEQDLADVDDEDGYFSVDHMARFSELALAFVVEQAGWRGKKLDESALWS